jgi:phospholipase C
MAMNAADRDPIHHVVMLILENHSFDQMLGCFKDVYPELDGVDPQAPRVNQDPAGNPYRQAPATERIMAFDPNHEVPHVAIQLADHNGGFVKDFVGSFPSSDTKSRALIMGYYPLGFLPALHTLARNFTVCDRWFSSLPGPTWPNRFFALSGTSCGRVNMPDDGTHKGDLPGYFQQDQTTLFDRLNDQGIHWKVYFHDVPQTTVLMHQREPHNAARYFYVDEFFADARGAESVFPQFCLIEPDYLGFEQNDDHPPHDIMRGETLVADVYNAIRANEALWRSTLLVLFWDEHGGFYDHVEPPPAPPPDSHREEYSFDRFGVRVPAVLISPWVDARVEHAQFDHTSVLKYLIDKWRLEPLGRRTDAAASIGAAIRRTRARDDAPARIELTPAQLDPPDPDADDAAAAYISTHQTALKLLATYLTEEALETAPRLYSWAARAIEAIVAVGRYLLDRVYDVNRGVVVSIAEPDRLARRKDAQSRDNVAEFLMRQKRYAVVGIRNRLRQAGLSPAQRQHTLQTLALLTGRKFHREPDNVKFKNAEVWLDLQTNRRRRRG